MGQGQTLTSINNFFMRKNIPYIIGCILVILIILIGRSIYIAANLTEEEKLLKKYLKTPDWNRFALLIEGDKKDLANKPNHAKETAATMDIGLQWFNLREFKYAVQWWEKGLGIEPNNTLGWSNLGNAYREIKEYSKAETAYEKSMELARPGETAACISLGELYNYNYKAKKDKEGEVYLNCLKKHTDDRDLIARLAGFYRDIGDKKNALKYFDKLFSIDPSPEVMEELKLLR